MWLFFKDGSVVKTTRKVVLSLLGGVYFLCDQNLVVLRIGCGSWDPVGVLK